MVLVSLSGRNGGRYITIHAVCVWGGLIAIYSICWYVSIVIVSYIYCFRPPIFCCHLPFLCFVAMSVFCMCLFVDFQKSLEIALQQKCVEVNILKCVTLGPPAVGKTQLRRALTGNYEKVTESTPVSTGAEVIIEKYMDSEAKWQRFDLGDGQKALVTSVRERDFAEVSSDSPHMETRSQRHNRSRKPVLKHRKLVLSIAKTRTLRRKLRESREHMMKQLQQTDRTGGKSLHKARIIHLIDSGGQPSFFDVHSALATSRAAYLQVFKLTEALHSKPRMTYRRKFKTKALDSRFRNIDFVVRTLVTLHDCKKKFMKMDKMIGTVISGGKSNDLPIFLIGTHMDKTEISETKKSVDSMIEKECQEFPIWNEVVHNGNLNFHPVSCLVQGKAGIAELQRKISDCRGGYPIRLPLSWFFVELMFWAKKAADDGCMRYSELRDICIQDNLLQSAEEFFTMVKLFHLLGLFSCPDLDRELEHDKLDDFPVFTDPSFLFGEVSKILDIPFRDGLSGSLRHLQDTGTLRQGALEDLKIPESAGTFSDFHEWLLERLILWGLAAAVKKRKEEGMVQMLRRGQELFIPSVLPPRPSTRDKDPDVCSLLVAFQDEDDSQSYHIPQGIFSHFIARLVQDKGYLVAPGVYRDLVSFKNVCPARVMYTVKIWEEMDHLAFSLVPESAKKCSSPASYDAIRKEFLNVLQTAWEGVYRSTPTLVVGFRCPCEGEGGSSRGHIAKYMEECQTLCCCNKFKEGKCIDVSSDQMKWFGISTG